VTRTRRLLRLTSTLSILLSLATLIAIPLSFFQALGIVRAHEQSSQVVRVVTGFITINDQRGPGMVEFFQMADQAPHSGFVEVAPVGDVKIYWEHVLCPGYYAPQPVAWPSGSVINRRVLIIPLWLLAVIFSLPKTLPALLRRRRHGTARNSRQRQGAPARARNR